MQRPDWLYSYVERYQGKAARPKPVQPTTYASLTLPSAGDMLIMTSVAIGMLLSYAWVAPWIVATYFPNSAMAYWGFGLGGLAATLLFPSLAVNRHRLSWFFLGEFAFRPWQLAALAQLRQVEPIRFDGESALARPAENLTGWLSNGSHLAEIEVTPTWSGPSYLTYRWVDALFAEQAYPGMCLSVRYRVSRLDPTRLQVKAAL